MIESSDKDRLLQDRQPPRIPVPKEIAVEIELEAPDRTRWVSSCIDIHIGGILLEFAPDNLPNVNVDSHVFVTIQLDGKMAPKIPAIVRHFVGRRLGLEFPDLSTQAPEQEDHLSLIVRSVEREVLRQKNQD